MAIDIQSIWSKSWPRSLKTKTIKILLRSDMGRPGECVSPKFCGMRCRNSFATKFANLPRRKSGRFWLAWNLILLFTRSIDDRAAPSSFVLFTFVLAPDRTELDHVNKHERRDWFRALAARCFFRNKIIKSILLYEFIASLSQLIRCDAS